MKIITNKDIVYSYNFENTKVQKSKIELYKETEEELFEIELENGSKVIASSKHQFFDKDNNRKTVNELKIGESIFIKNEI
jgi:hypothetical protein